MAVNDQEIWVSAFDVLITQLGEDFNELCQLLAAIFSPAS